MIRCFTSLALTTVVLLSACQGEENQADLDLSEANRWVEMSAPRLLSMSDSSVLVAAGAELVEVTPSARHQLAPMISTEAVEPMAIGAIANVAGVVVLWTDSAVAIAGDSVRTVWRRPAGDSLRVRTGAVGPLGLVRLAEDSVGRPMEIHRFEVSTQVTTVTPIDSQFRGRSPLVITPLKNGGVALAATDTTLAAAVYLPDGSSRQLEVPPLVTDLIAADPVGWRGLQVVELDRGYIRTFVSLRSPERVTVRYGTGGSVQRATPLNAPLAFIASNVARRQLVAILDRGSGERELILYDWEWRN